MDWVNISQEQFSQLQLHNGISWGSFKKVDSWIPLSKMLMAVLWCLLDALKALNTQQRLKTTITVVPTEDNFH